MSRALAFGIFFFCFTTFACFAQSTDSGPQPQSQTPAAAAPQTASQESNATGAAASGQTKKKTKKVWTNEEMSSVGGNVSVVGDSSQTRHAEGTTNVTNANNAQRIAAYRNQILQYRKQMDALDKQIADFRNFKADNSSGGMDPHIRYTMTPSEDRIKQLEDKKKQIQAKIDTLEDAARKEGIEPGQLR
jgi:multidrug efflux pump subunit AcrB